MHRAANCFQIGFYVVRVFLSLFRHSPPTSRAPMQVIDIQPQLACNRREKHRKLRQINCHEMTAVRRPIEQHIMEAYLTCKQAANEQENYRFLKFLSASHQSMFCQTFSTVAANEISSICDSKSEIRNVHRCRQKTNRLLDFDLLQLIIAHWSDWNKVIGAHNARGIWDTGESKLVNALGCQWPTNKSIFRVNSSCK